VCYVKQNKVQASRKISLRVLIGFRVLRSGFKIEGWGLGYRVKRLGLRVQSF